MTENNQGDTGTPDPREIRKVKLDLDASPEIKLKLSEGNIYFYGPETIIGAASSFAGIEAFPAGETMTWFFVTDEWQYVFKGEAEVTYSLYSTFHTEQRTMHVGPGDFFFIPAGARVTWKVAPGEDLLHLVVVLLVSAPRERADMRYLKPEVIERLT